MTLRISDELTLPLETTTQPIAIIARRGAGKTYTAAVITEEMIKAGVPVVVIDPMGAFWGLRSSADGTQEGLPVTILGGEHGDVPLEPTAGKAIARFVVEHPGPYVLDLSLFESNAAQDRFATDFGEAIYRLKAKAKAPLHLVVDEADSFAPQRPQPGQQRMLGAYEAIVRRGRIRGLGMTMITQRPAVLNKNVLTQAEILITLQMTGPQDRKAIDAWVQGHGTIEERDELLASLAGLQKGQAWIWSPSLLNVFKLVQIRRRETFDSSKTPEMGEHRTEPERFAPVDLAALQQEMAATIEQAKAEDPKELRKEIARLKRELQDRPAEIEQVEVEKVVEVPVLSGKQLAEWSEAVEKMQRTATFISNLADNVEHALNKVADRPVPNPKPPTQIGSIKLTTPTVRTSAPRREPPVEPSSDLSKGERAVLSVLAQYPQGRTISQLAILSGYRISGGFRNTLSSLRTRGAIEGGNTGVMSITSAGLDELGTWDPLPTGTALVEYWKGSLSKGEAAILQALVDVYPEGLTIDDLAERTGYQVSGGFRNMLSKLRTIELIQGRNTEAMRASDIFF